MTTTRSTIFGAARSDAILRWTNRGIEFLWLLAVLLVPVAFLDRQYAISEAVIAYVEIPKVALLRTLAGLIAMLWLLEWGLADRSISFPPFLADARRFRFRPLIAITASWLRAQPSRWLWLAVWFYLATVLMGTIFSASFSVSLWGEVPGQDGYPAYTIAAYAVLFGAIGTHLKTGPRLWRLLGAIVVMGVLVSGYSVLQHYGHDFFNLKELTGGGISRTTSLAGNSIFAAAVMSMTIPISLFVAAASLRDTKEPKDNHRNLGEWFPTFFVAGVWVLILTIQLMGITFTFSRGPWMGAILAIAAGGGMTAVFAGWSGLGRITVLMGVATGLTFALVQWDVPVYSIGLWLGAAVTLAGLIGIAAVWGWRILGRVFLALGVAAVLAIAVMFVPSWINDGLDPVDNQSTSGAESSSFGDTQAAQRFSSIRGNVSSGTLGGRVDTWLVSWELIRDRPWFEFDELSFPWIRPFLGYGPDLFRYAYLLKSVPQGGGLAG